MPARSKASPRRASSPKNGPGQRASWGSLSREQVIEAALDIVRAGNFETMTMRSLATELGVAPMSLYRHIQSKDDLLDEVAEVLLKQTWRPPTRARSWRTWISDAANDLRELLVAEPAVLYVYLRRPVVTPTAVDRMEAMIGELRKVGFGLSRARDAYAAIHTYTVGFAALEASRANWRPAHYDDALANQLAGYTTPRQFDRGLAYLLDGIENRGQ
jgi:AcrR family transcriptional regulator